MNEVAPTGVDWPGAGERLERLREAVKLIHELWTGEQVHFEGQWYKTGGAVIYDIPSQPIPIWIAAGGPKGARFAGAEGGLITTSGKPRELYAERLLPNAEAGATRGRARSRRHRAHDRDQALVRDGPRDRRRRLPLLGAARAARRGQAGRRGSARARAPRRRARRRAGRLALHLHGRPRRGRRSASRPTSSSASATSSSTARRTISSASSSASRPRSPRACARSDGDLERAQGVRRACCVPDPPVASAASASHSAPVGAPG